MRRRYIALGIVIAASGLQAAPPAVRHLRQRHRLPGTVLIVSNTFSSPTKQPDSGPFTYTVTVQNTGSTSVTATATCTSLVSPAQTGCDIETDGDNFTLTGSQSRTLTVTYSTLGLGQFQHKVVVTKNGVKTDSATYSYITVTGTPMESFMTPLPGLTMNTGDSVKVVYSHPSGLSSSSYKLFVDGADSTSHVTKDSADIRWLSTNFSSGTHTLTSYGCSVSGRCDSASTTVTVLASTPPSYSLDDSLPPGPANAVHYTLLAGALPTPPTEYRGCPQHQGDPDIKLSSPETYAAQNAFGSTAAGNIFMPSIVWDNTITISSITIDHTPTDTWTCSSSTWLTYSDYDWNGWMHGDPHDSMWATYDYGDGTPPGYTGFVPTKSEFGFTSEFGKTSDNRVRKARPTRAVNPFAALKLPSPGAIDTGTYWVRLNGTLLVSGGHKVYSAVTRVSMDLIGSTFTLPSTDALVHRYHPDSTTHSSGEGWNELIAGIADSTGHWDTVRARFVVVDPGTPHPIGIAALRNFAHLDQSDCAAFGAFQCGGVTLVQAIPGFVTRDHDRSLHLVYRSASQRAPVALPYQISIGRFAQAPDSLHAFLNEGGSTVSDSTMRYAGVHGPGGYSLLDEYADETRVLGAELPAQSSGSEAVRRIQLNLQSYYNGSVRTDTMSQDFIEVHWSDTTRARFGPGWHLAETSQLAFSTYQGQSVALWMHGDGSNELFRYSGSAWISPAGETAVLLTRSDSDSSDYAIEYPNGTAVGFTSSGYQRYSRDLLGNKTYYSYTGTRLHYITDPSGIRYEFSYDGSGRVTEVGFRTSGGSYTTLLNAGYDGSGNLNLLRSWKDGSHCDSTSFRYAASAPGAFIDSVIDPRGQVTTFSYDSRLWMPTGSTTPPLRGTRMSMTFRDQWSRSTPRVGHGRTSGQDLEWLRYPNQYLGTYIPVAGTPTDYEADAFGGPTYVRHYSTEPIMTTDFLLITYGGDDVRNITRDTTGHVTKIVSASDSTAITDSVMYTYDASWNLLRTVKPTAEWPIGSNSLDTTSYAWDSVTSLSYTGQHCVRMLRMTDPSGGVDSVAYGSSGVGQCLPVRVRGFAGDTTHFTYGTLSAGVASGVRPVSSVGASGVTESVTYDATTWNTAGSQRNSDAAASMFYDAFGRADSAVDPVGTPTVTHHDQLGRVYLARTGTGSNAPVTHTFFSAGGLVDSVRIYGTSSDVTASASTSVQTSKFFYNALGWVDSSFTPGGRRRVFWRNGLGEPYFEETGHGTFISREFDWQGRLVAEYLGQARPGYSVDGTAFADAGTTTAYTYFGLTPGVTLHSGELHAFTYDNRGHVSAQSDTMLTTARSYNRAGELIADTLTFTDGAKVVRNYSYSRRGQRTMIADTVMTGSTFLTAGRTDYTWNSTTGRLDSLDAKRDGGARIATTIWKYDAAGRDTLRVVVPWTSGGSAGHPDS